MALRSLVLVREQMNLGGDFAALSCQAEQRLVMAAPRSRSNLEG